MDREIGGYLELDLYRNYSTFHKDLISVNSSRNGLRYVIRAYNIKKLWVPYYTCPVIWTAARQENCELMFYSIDEHFLPKEKIPEVDYVLYTNYFGICSNNVNIMSQRFENLILDNAHAFFSKPNGIGCFYSPRKFFGVSDGGFVYCKKDLSLNIDVDISWDRFSFLLHRIDSGANAAYAEFNKNEEYIDNSEIKTMSVLTTRILQNIDYEYSKNKRIENFNYLHNELKSLNKLEINLCDDVPMFYPLVLKNEKLRNKLIENKIYIQTCWKGMEKECKNRSYELFLQSYLFPLIIDQRYSKTDMDRILAVILES